MASIQSYLIAGSDNYRPQTSKPSLQQWDNYQIHDVYCTDVIGVKENSGFVESKNNIANESEFLAVQVYAPEVIECNFNAIALAYP